MNIIAFFDRLRSQRALRAYRKSIPEKVALLRKKDKIRVVFIISNFDTWKSEALYLAMRNHPRFEPLLVITNSLEYQLSENINNLRQAFELLEDKGYPYIEKPNGNFVSLSPDIIFYEKPYSGLIAPALGVHYNRFTLFCYVNYGFNSVQDPWFFTHNLHKHCWQIYFENKVALNLSRTYLPKWITNGCFTGLPFTESLMLPKEDVHNPWSERSGNRKRIIFAPHHSINPDNAITYGSFLENCEIMLEIAKKYSNQIFFAFKPHPLLQTKLQSLWGKKQADEYYSCWRNLENAQVCTSDYIGLFLHSDAMIHDCCSFQIEYHYTHKPVFYLISPDKEEYHKSTLNEFGQMAFDVHYKGHTQEEIESFIKNVIAGKDEMYTKRMEFYRNHLLPPNGKSPSENIINEILGNDS